MSEQAKFFANFEGKRVINGTKRNFWIQTATEEYYDGIIDGMINGFILDEPLFKNVGIYGCKQSIKEMKELYLKHLKANNALVCLTKDSNNVTKIAGMNVTFVLSKYIKLPELKGERLLHFFRIIQHIKSIKDVFNMLDIDAYLCAMGLYVMPDFRGEGIGLEFLKAREPLCKSLGLKATCTVFTSPAGQSVAVKAGFKDITNIRYEDIFKEQPELFVPNLEKNTTYCRYMYIKYD